MSAVGGSQDASVNNGTAIPRLSATLVVIRDGPLGLQALLLKRANRGDQNSGAWVFPGGLLDESDRACHIHCEGLSNSDASLQLGLPDNGLDFYIAAMRECFEESGLLLSNLNDAVRSAFDLMAWRARLNERQVNFADFCAQHNVKLAADQLHFISHWITPLGMPKRFDTRFFLAQAPSAQLARHDGAEMVDHQWIGVTEVLEENAAVKVLGPARSILKQLSGFANVLSALEWASKLDNVQPTMPQLVKDEHGRIRAVIPGA